MPPYIILDSGPLSNCVLRINPSSGFLTPSQECRQWLTACEKSGATLLVPAISYYETLREMERRQAVGQVQRLKTYSFLPGCFVPITTAHLEAAARLWAQARMGGKPTANDAALDADIILCAQVQALGLPASDYVVATTNVKHLTQFVNADLWQNIK